MADRLGAETGKRDVVLILGCAPDSPWRLGVLLWMNGLRVVRSGASSRRSSPRNDVFHGYRVVLADAGGRAHAGARGVFGARRRPSRGILAHCALDVQRRQGLFSWGPSNRPMRVLRQGGRANIYPGMY